MNSEQLILCLAARTRIVPEDEQQLLALVRGTLDWELLWSQGHLHEVLPLLATTMRRVAAQAAIPQPWLARAQRRLYATLIRNTTLADTLIEVLAAFQRAGIAGIPVKGVVLAETIYGGLGLRSLGDLDVLVQPADLPAARAVLKELQFVQEADPGFENMHHPFHDPPYYRQASGGDICLELHRGLWATQFFQLGTDALWTRSSITPLHGAEVRVLSPEDTLLHLAIHRSRSALRLRFVCDIAELLQRHAEALDWDYLLAQARVAGARTALFYALALAQELSAAPLPPGILPRLGIGALKRRLLEHTCGVSALFRPVAADDLSQQPSLMLRMFEQDGLGHIAWNIAANMARKSRKYIYNYRHAQKTSQADGA
jgi:Uncharacterised nucleotidyltransferase